MSFAPSKMQNEDDVMNDDYQEEDGDEMADEAMES